MNIAIIGAGSVGKTLGRRWAELGHDIRFGVQNPDDDKYNALSEIAGSVVVTSNAEAAMSAEVVVFSTPRNVTEAAIQQCGALEGRIVIDCTNPVKLGSTDEMLEVGFDNSAGEMVAKWAMGAHVFKSLNQVGWEIMENPVLEGRKAIMFFAGPDGEEKQTVDVLISSLGFEVFYLGDITLSRLLEPFGMTWIYAALAMGMGREWAFSIVRREN